MELTLRSWRWICRVMMYLAALTPLNCAAAVTLHQSCKAPLIEANASNVFTASSFYSKQYEPSNALLNTTGAWIPHSSNGLNSSEYLQIDLGTEKQVTSVATQGASGMSGYFVKKFHLEYSLDGVIFDSYREDGEDKSFDGNTDNVGIKVNVLHCAVVARYLRFYPLTIEKGVALKVQVYGCNSSDSSQARHSIGLSDIKVTSVTFGEIEISWSVQSSSHVVDFYITYHAEHDKNGTEHQTVSPSHKSTNYKYKLMKLLPCKTYDITVVAFGRCHSEVKKLQAQTTASIPAAPVILSATSSTPNTIELKWEDPRKSVRRCPIDVTSYSVRYYKTGSDVGRQMRFIATKFEAILKNLESWAEYVVELRAESVYGYSLGATKKVSVEGSAPTEPPVITEAVSTAPGTIYVKWKAPPKDTIGGKIKSFTVLVREKESDVIQTYTVSHDQREVTLEHLTEEAIYQVRLRMSNEGYVISSNVSEVYVIGRGM